MNFAKSVSLNLSAGGKVGGNLEIDGDLTVNGDSSGAYDEIINGHLDLADNNILNVGDISLDTISSDAGTSINVVLGSDSGDDFLVDTDKLVVEGDTGKVGIGTASPTALFEVETDDENIARFNGSQGNIDFRYGSDIEFDRAGIVYITANNGSGELQLRTGGQNPRLHIDEAGLVGIGTISPNTTLTLSDGTDEFDFGVTTNQLMIKSVTSDGSDDQRIIIDAGNGGQSSTRGAYIALSGNEASSEAGKAIYQTGNVSGSSHVFRISGGSDALTIDSSGNATFAGTVFVPEYIKHDGDTNTSLRFLSDRIILNAGGNNAIDIGTSEIAINHDQANIDFRVESDTNDHALFVDAGVSCVSINRSSSYGNAPLHIVGEGDVDSMGYPQLILEGDTHDYPGILFRGGSGTHGAMRIEGGDGFSFWTTDHSSISWNNRLRIEEDGTFTGSSSADISDRNLKKNIKSISNGLETIKKLQGRTFEWKKSSNMAEGVKYGLIAQELEEVLPDLVYDKSGIVEKEDGTFYKSVFMGGVIPVLIEAVKELSDKLDTSNAKITALENA